MFYFRQTKLSLSKFLSTNNNVVVTIGEIVVDWISLETGPSFEQAHDFCRAVGGNATNVAIAISRLGGKSRLIGKIGTDLHGNFLRCQLSSERVNLDFLYDDQHFPTAQCYAVRDAADEALYYNWPRPNAADMLCVDDITDDAFVDGTCIHATAISLIADPRKTAVFRALELAKSKDIIVSFDAGFPTDSAKFQADGKKAFALADIIKINLAELLFWTGFPRNEMDDHKARLIENNFSLSSANLQAVVEAFMLEHKPTVLLLTLGEHGCFVITNELQIYCHIYPVKSLCSIGAGDAFIAGILYCLADRSLSLAAFKNLNESEWQLIGSFGNAVGGLATRSVSAVAGLPSKEEVDCLMQRHH